MAEKINPKVLVLSATFPPRGGSSVQRVAKQVKYLQEFGYAPIVMTCSEPNLSIRDDTLLEDIPPDVEVIRVSKIFGQKGRKRSFSEQNTKTHQSSVFTNKKKKLLPQIRLKRFLYPDEYIIWAFLSFKTVRKKLLKHNISIIFTSFGSPSGLLLGYLLKKKYNFPWVVDIRDFWSLNEMKFQYTRRPFPLNIIDSYIEKICLRGADHIIVISDYYKIDLTDKLHIKSDKIDVIWNGFDEDDFAGITPKKNDIFTVRYVGFIIKEQPIESFFQALKELRADGVITSHKVRLEIVGGSNTSNARKLIREYGVKDFVRQIPYQSHREAIRMMVGSDLLLFIPGLGKGTITGKLFEYIRSGSSILMMNQGNDDAVNILTNVDSTYIVDAFDIKKIKMTIVSLYEAWLDGTERRLTNCSASFLNTLSRRSQAKKLTRIFDSKL